MEAGQQHREEFLSQLESTAVAVGTAQARRLALQQLSVLVQEVSVSQPSAHLSPGEQQASRSHAPTESGRFRHPSWAHAQRSYKSMVQRLRRMVLAVRAVRVRRTAV